MLQEVAPMAPNSLSSRVGVAPGVAGAPPSIFPLRGKDSKIDAEHHGQKTRCVLAGRQNQHASACAPRTDRPRSALFL